MGGELIELKGFFMDIATHEEINTPQTLGSIPRYVLLHNAISRSALDGLDTWPDRQKINPLEKKISRKSGRP